MKPVNILLVSSKYEPEYAGSGIRARNTYKRLAGKFPVNFEVLAGSITQNSCGAYSVDGRKVTRIAKKPFSLATDEAGRTKIWDKPKHAVNYIVELAFTWKFLIFNIRRFDLIHVFGKNWVTAAVVTFAKIIKKPLIVELCNEVSTPYHYETAIFKWIYGERFHKNTAIICISAALEKMCRKYGYKENVVCRPNPVDTSKFYIDYGRKEKLRREYTKFAANDILLLCISKFRPSKNQIFLIDVLKRLGVEYKLLLAGPVVESGPLRKRDQAYLESIKRAVREHRLEPRIEIQVKFISNVDEYLKMSDVFVFPTTTEALGTPMLEAFCSGVPVVANRIPDVTDYWIEEGKNGFVSRLDTDEFAEKIVRTARIDKAVLKEKRDAIAALCSTEVIDKQYFDLIEKLTGRK